MTPVAEKKNPSRGLRVANNNSKKSLPSPLKDLEIRELFLLTGIPLHLLEGFSNGKFKPNSNDRETLTKASLRFYQFTPRDKRNFLNRTKYRALKKFISISEKEELFNDLEHYSKNLDQLIGKYWDRIILEG